jgi:hypothetical protein
MPVEKIWLNKQTNEIVREVNRWTNKDNLEEIDNYEFEDTIDLHSFYHNNSTYNVVFKCRKDGRLVSFFGTEFESKIVKNMVHGAISGCFTFRKSGGRYACTTI